MHGEVAVCIMAELEPDLLGETDLETLLYLIKHVPPNWGKTRLRVRDCGSMRLTLSSGLRLERLNYWRVVLSPRGGL